MKGEWAKKCRCGIYGQQRDIKDMYCMGYNQVSVRVITKPVNIGPCGLRDRNESGDLLADLCVVNELVVSNNTFQQHPRRLYT